MPRFVLLPRRRLSLAETLAGRAIDLTKGINSGSLDTLARVQFMLGKKPEAIATLEKAVNAEKNPKAKTALEKTLTTYRAGKLPDAEN